MKTHEELFSHRNKLCDCFKPITPEEILERIATSAELREDVFGPRQVDPHKLAELLAELINKQD